MPLKRGVDANPTSDVPHSHRTWPLLAAVVIGLVLGPTVYPHIKNYYFLTSSYIGLIKGLAAPLLAVTVFLGFLDINSPLKGFRRLAFICLINMCGAIVIALTLANIFPLGDFFKKFVNDETSLTAPSSHGGTAVTLVDGLKSMIPDSVIRPFIESNMPSIMLLTLLFGFSLRSFAAGLTDSKKESLFTKLSDSCTVIQSLLFEALSIILFCMPVVVFLSVAKAASLNGFQSFIDLLSMAGLSLGGLLLQVGLVYFFWIAVISKRSFMNFWREARHPAILGFSSNSSLAALPATLRALKRLKVSDQSARFGACIGTNFNNDGILLYEVLAVLLIGGSLGLNWSLGEQVYVAILCVVAALGVSGFPEAGVVALTIVMSTLKLPLELIPVLLSVDWFVARMRSATNVIADMTVSIGMDALRPSSKLNSKNDENDEPN